MKDRLDRFLFIMWHEASLLPPPPPKELRNANVSQWNEELTQFQSR